MSFTFYYAVYQLQMYVFLLTKQTNYRKNINDFLSIRIYNINFVVFYRALKVSLYKRAFPYVD